MLYLLDANVLIDANRDYYPVDGVPEFWEWLVRMGEMGKVKIPQEVYEEISGGNDNLASWAKQSEIKTCLLLNEEVDTILLQKVVNEGYAEDLTDFEMDQLGQDPFLISYGLKNNVDRCVVTTEVSKPNKLRAKRHVPDVCNSLGIHCCHSFDFIKRLGFTTKWRDLL